MQRDNSSHVDQNYKIKEAGKPVAIYKMRSY